MSPIPLMEWAVHRDVIDSLTWCEFWLGTSVRVRRWNVKVQLQWLFVSSNSSPSPILPRIRHTAHLYRRNCALHTNLQLRCKNMTTVPMENNLSQSMDSVNTSTAEEEVSDWDGVFFLCSLVGPGLITPISATQRHSRGLVHFFERIYVNIKF